MRLPAKANARSCAIPGSAAASSAKRKPSNAKSVTMIARISARISSASPFALEPSRLLHEAAPVGIGERGEHADLDRVLERGEQAAADSAVGERLVVADHDQLELAHQQRHEAEEDHRVHHAGLPVAPDHPRLQEAIRSARSSRAANGRSQRTSGASATTIASLRQASPANAMNATSMSSEIPRGLIVGGVSGREAVRIGEANSDHALYNSPSGRQRTTGAPMTRVNEGSMSARREAMEYDVVIVGGGPAGLAAAIRLKQLAAEAETRGLGLPPREGLRGRRAHPVGRGDRSARAGRAHSRLEGAGRAARHARSREDRFLFLTQEQACAHSRTR